MPSAPSTTNRAAGGPSLVDAYAQVPAEALIIPRINSERCCSVVLGRAQVTSSRRVGRAVSSSAGVSASLPKRQRPLIATGGVPCEIAAATGDHAHTRGTSGWTATPSGHSNPSGRLVRRVRSPGAGPRLALTKTPRRRSGEYKPTEQADHAILHFCTYSLIIPRAERQRARNFY